MSGSRLYRPENREIELESDRVRQLLRIVARGGHQLRRRTPSLITREPRSDGLFNNPRNLSGALSKPENLLKMGMVVGSGLTR